MITISLNGTELPPLEIPFIRKVIENATDVQTLDGNIYTDFVSLPDAYEVNWKTMLEADYEFLKAAYNAQFSSFTYPEITIPHFGVTDVPARMLISDRDTWNHCGDVQDLHLTFRLLDIIDEEYLLVNGEKLFVTGNDYLIVE